MGFLNEIVIDWYPIIWLASAGIALIIWIRAIKRKARLDIDQATKLILERRYRNGQMSKKEYDRRTESL